jgi:endoglucanase
VEKDGSDWYWWGGNLIGVGRAGVTLSLPNRVVYSPHDYGPEVYPQGWFKDPTFPANLPSVWDAHWGYIARDGIAPVVLGEFGGRSVGSDPAGQWQRALLNYVQGKRLGYISWALNPDSGDTGGILQDDWLTVQSSKQNLYTQGASPPAPAAGAQSTGNALRLTYHLASADTSSPNVAFVVSLFNTQSQSLSLADLGVRYWLAEDPSLIQATVDWALIGQSHIQISVVPQTCGNQQGYLELKFDSGSGSILGYGTTGPILVRYHRADWLPFDPSRDRGYGPTTTDEPWPQIQIVRDFGIIWGQALSC